MVTVPLGVQAYKRAYAGELEVKLINRFMEQNPTNLREKTSLLARPGETSLGQFTGGRNRGAASFTGLFGTDLFIVYGTTLYRVSQQTGLVTPVTGTVQDNGFTYFSWMKGAGYEYLFVSDGQSLQYYMTRAIGVLTVAAGGSEILDVDTGGQIIDIGGIYYAWSANVDSGAPAGTLANPFRAALGTASAGVTKDQASLANMVLLINFNGLSGFDFSTNAFEPSPYVSASSGPTTLNLVSVPDNSEGNSIPTTVPTGSNISFASGTLTGGGNQALQTVPMPVSTEAPTSITALSGYVLVDVGGTQRFRWLEPGAVIFDPLDFASKESNPDPIISMVTVGDQAIICGAGSTENWYATGDFTAPFAPVEGRTYRRGVLAGTECPVKDSLFVVGDDGVVYSIGYTYGDTSTYGVHRVSTNAIEERIRTQMRILQGLPA